MSSPTTENSTPGLRRAPRGFSFLDGDTPAGELTPDLSGQTLGGRFEVLRRVGKGGMGVIYIAMDRELPSRAAVKVLSSRKTGAEMRFAEEIAILANVRHPHLVAVLGAGHSAGGLPYLAMEYLEGENLEERLEGGALPWREAVELAIQVTGALTALHAAGVIHRDVKPSNVMLVESSTGQRVAKLIDLGVAKTLPALWERHRVGPQPARHQTEVGRVVGTAGYQPPEAGLAPPDPRLDVYALGATLYKLCTRRMPVAGVYVPMREACPGAAIPSELEAVVAGALALDADERLPTAEALLRALERVRDAYLLGDSGFLFDGRYDLIKVLGMGGSAEVHLAHHRGLRQDVALKVLSKNKQTEEWRARLEREARVLAAVSHPVLPRVFDYHVAESGPYLALEYAPGQRASQFCDVQNRLSPEDVVTIGLQLAGALEALHALGVVHRDINNTNVLVHFFMEGPRRAIAVKLIDLGQCELLPAWYARSGQRYATPPEERVALGTGRMEQFPWTAPEGRRRKVWTEKSDVYSAASVLYQLLTGKRPTDARSDEPVDPRELVPCSAGLAHALLAALHPEPAHRLDAAGLRERLAQVGAGDDEDEDASMEVEGAHSRPTGECATALAQERAPTDTPVQPPPVAPEPSARAGDSAPVVPEPVLSAGAPVGEPGPATSAWTRRALLIAAGLLGIWLFGQPRGSERAAEVGAGDEVATRPAEQPRALEVPPVSPAVTTPVAAATTTASQPPLPDFRAALEGARARLEQCATEAGEVVLVELAAEAGAETLSKIEVFSVAPAAACAREVLRGVRFRSGAAQVFREEYGS